MSLPMSPLLLLLQNHSETAEETMTGSEAQIRVVQLLGGLTLNPQEEEILKIVSELSPQEFVRFLTLLAEDNSGQYVHRPNVSYLEVLYDDMHGKEFQAFNHLMKAKLLAFKFGSGMAALEALKRVTKGQCVEQIQYYETYVPNEVTDPSTWLTNAFPSDTHFTESGVLNVIWRIKKGITDFGVSAPTYHFSLQPTDLVAVEQVQKKGMIDIMTCLEIKNMADTARRTQWFDTVNIAGIILGMGAYAAAKGAAKKAVIGLFQVAMPMAGQYISEHEEEILELNYGPEFLYVWQWANLLMAGFGIAHLLGAGDFLVAMLKRSRDRLEQYNLINSMITEIGQRIDDLIDSIKDFKSKLLNTGPGMQSTGGGAPQGPPSLPGKKPAIDPHYPGPSHLQDATLLATAETEVEMLHKLRTTFSKEENVDVFLHERDGFYILVKHAFDEIDLQHAPTGYLRVNSIRNIISVSENFQRMGARFLDEIYFFKRKNNPMEIGLYKKVYSDGKIRYAVVKGTKDGITSPDITWTLLAHSHPGAETQAFLHFPSMLDFEAAVKQYQKVEREMGVFVRTESIASFNKADDLVKIDFGYDANQSRRMWVTLLDGKKKYFLATYPDALADDVKLLSNKLLRKELTELEYVRELKNLFNTNKLDPDLYYGAWWANLLT